MIKSKKKGKRLVSLLFALELTMVFVFVPLTINASADSSLESFSGFDVVTLDANESVTFFDIGSIHLSRGGGGTAEDLVDLFLFSNVFEVYNELYAPCSLSFRCLYVDSDATEVKEFVYSSWLQTTDVYELVGYGAVGFEFGDDVFTILACVIGDSFVNGGIVFLSLDSFDSVNEFEFSPFVDNAFFLLDWSLDIVFYSWAAVTVKSFANRLVCAVDYSSDSFWYIGLQDGEYRGYNNGFSAGYSAGSIAGWNDGYTFGYDLGYELGRQAGYTAGYNVGETDGQEIGYALGYDEGYRLGILAGVDSVDIQVEFNRGWNQGYNNGYDSGYIDGQGNTAGKALSGFIPSIIGAIAGFFLTLMNGLEVWGLSPGSIVATVGGLFLILFIIRTVLGS